MNEKLLKEWIRQIDRADGLSRKADVLDNQKIEQRNRERKAHQDLKAVIVEILK